MDGRILAFTIFGIIQSIVYSKAYSEFNKSDFESVPIQDKISNPSIDEFDLKLLLINGISPNMRGYKNSFFPSNDILNCKLYSDFLVLSFSSEEDGNTHWLQVPKSDCSIKYDIFAGKMLGIKVNKNKLSFKIQNKEKMSVYKSWLKS